MNNKRRKLLLSELCARLPYGVQIRTSHDKERHLLTAIDIDNEILFSDEEEIYAPLSKIKPYLIPMDKITPEQREELNRIFERHNQNSPDTSRSVLHFSSFAVEYVNWCLRNHIDYNNLIGKKLAIDATKYKNNPYAPNPELFKKLN